MGDGILFTKHIFPKRWPYYVILIGLIIRDSVFDPKLASILAVVLLIHFIFNNYFPTKDDVNSVLVCDQFLILKKKDKEIKILSSEIESVQCIESDWQVARIRAKHFSILKIELKNKDYFRMPIADSQKQAFGQAVQDRCKIVCNLGY